MQQSIQIKITAPCQENWNKMSATKEGKFCMSCQKEVIDFSGMSDKEILKIITKASSSICGRTDSQQLNRSLVLPPESRKTWWKYWVGLAASVLVMTPKSNAQKKTTIARHSVAQSPNKSHVSSQIAARLTPLLSSAIVICGRVVDTNGVGIPYASVVLKNAGRGIATDAAGFYTFRINSDWAGVELIISSVGYENQVVDVNSMMDEKKSTDISINTILHQATMKEVVVTGAVTERLVGYVGGLSVLRVEPSIMEQAKEVVKDIFGTKEIKIYPNPVKLNTTFNIAFNIAMPGEYNIQFVDVSGKIIYGKNINIISRNYMEQCSADIFPASGAYFVYLTSADMRKNYTAKLIVQY